MLYLQSGTGGIFTSMWPILLMFVVIYFFMIRPQARKQKQQKGFERELQKGDEVATTSGIIGKVNRVDGDIVHIQIDTKTFIRVLKSSVSKEMTDGIQSAKKEG